MGWHRVKVIVRRVAFSIPVAAAFMDCVGYAAKVEGHSMQPLFNPDPSQAWLDVVFLNRMVTFDFEQIKRGDVIAFTSPRDPSQKLIKRVIALQGDSVRPLEGGGVVHIPPGHCWVEGDNHKHSFDSNHFGPVSLGLMVAKATYIVWPPGRVAAIESRLPPERTFSHERLCQNCLSSQLTDLNIEETSLRKTLNGERAYSSTRIPIVRSFSALSDST